MNQNSNFVFLKRKDFKLIQLLHAIPKLLKKNISAFKDTIDNLTQDHHLTKHMHF